MKKNLLLFALLSSSIMFSGATVSASHDSDLLEQQTKKLNQESVQYMKEFNDEVDKAYALCENSEPQCILDKSFAKSVGFEFLKIKEEADKLYINKIKTLDSNSENYTKDYINIYNQAISYYETKQQAQVTLFTKAKSGSLEKAKAARLIMLIEDFQNGYRALIYTVGESHKERVKFQKALKVVDKAAWMDESRRKFYRDNAEYFESNEARSAFTTKDSNLYTLGNILSAEAKVSAPEFFSQCKIKNFLSTSKTLRFNNLACGRANIEILKFFNKTTHCAQEEGCGDLANIDFVSIIDKNLDSYKAWRESVLSSKSKSEKLYSSIGVIVLSDLIYLNYGIYESLYGDSNNEVYNSIMAVVKPGTSSSSSNDTTMSKSERDLLVRGQDKATPYEKTILQSDLVDTKYLSTAVVNSTTTSCPTLVGEYVKQNTSKKYNEHHFMITNGKIYCVNTAMPGSSYPFYGSVQNYYKDYFYALETKTPAPSKAEVSCTTPRVMYWAGKHKLHLNTETCMWESDTSRTDDELLSYCKTLYPKTTSVKLFAIGESSDSWNSAGGVGYRKMMPSFECVQ